MTIKSVLERLGTVPNPQGEEKSEVASPPKRLIAFLIDYGVIMLMLMTIRPLFLPNGWDEMSFEQSILYLIPVVFIGFCFFLVKDLFQGVSLGKAFFNLKVRNLDQDFSIPESKVLILRNLFYLILPVELFFLLSDPYCRRLGDRYLNSIVLITNKPPTVRQLTHRVIATFLVIAIAWLLWIFITPVAIKRSSAYQAAETALLESSDIRQEIGEIKSFGYWPDVNYSVDKVVYRIRVNPMKSQDEAAQKTIQVILEKSGSLLVPSSIMILADQEE